MKEARSARYGRFLAYYLRKGIDDRDYLIFLEELAKYSNIPRKKGEKRNSGCINELEDLDFDASNPRHVARLIKEGLHLMYQKQTSRRVLDSFLASFKKASKAR